MSVQPCASVWSADRRPSSAPGQSPTASARQPTRNGTDKAAGRANAARDASGNALAQVVREQVPPDPRRPGTWPRPAPSRGWDNLTDAKAVENGGYDFMSKGDW